MQKITDYIPHKYPFLFVDKILFYKKYNNILVLKNITFSEKYFSGHFLFKPIVPGVLIIESMAQASCLLANISLGLKVENPNFFLIGIEKARFKIMAVPGDQLYLESCILNIKNGIWKFSCFAFIDGKLACKTKIICIEKYDLY